MKEKASIEDAKKEEAMPVDDPRGIPEFWLTIFKSVDMLSDMLQVCFHAPACPSRSVCGSAYPEVVCVCVFSPPRQEHDEPILKHLKDIQVKFSEPGQPMVRSVMSNRTTDVVST